ncbi:hypothetical protein [Arthrobacter sp. 260]|uniref:hypothetical protein n=1 Tax=Arthrobacter sp. 260 TaxID=2735314 RepID=UPI0014914398|nr:hypothetical protein [Arthrobacter sp. 260]NOJ59739.1 hypothetical protein [Arthrobacter sp. 260]
MTDHTKTAPQASKKENRLDPAHIFLGEGTYPPIYGSKVPTRCGKLLEPRSRPGDKEFPTTPFAKDELCDTCTLMSSIGAVIPPEGLAIESRKEETK